MYSQPSKAHKKLTTTQTK